MLAASLRESWGVLISSGGFGGESAEEDSDEIQEATRITPFCPASTAPNPFPECTVELEGSCTGDCISA